MFDDCLANGKTKQYIHIYAAHQILGWMKHDLRVILSRLNTYMIAFDYWRSIAIGDFRYDNIHHESLERIKHLARLMSIENEHADYIMREIQSMTAGRAIGPDQV
jgi:glycosidase